MARKQWTLTHIAIQQLKMNGYVAEKVEQRLPIPGKCVTRDLFGCIDIVAMGPGRKLLAVQVTSSTNVAARAKKSLAMAQVWVAAGGAFEVWGYRTGQGNYTKRRLVMEDGVWIET